MYKYIDNYVNTNHVTIPLPAPPPPPPTHLPLIPVILSRRLYVKHKTIVGNVIYIYTVGYLSNWYYFLLPYYNSIVTTPVHWNSHSPPHTIKLVYCNNHPHKHKLIYTNNILLTNTLLFFKILILIIWVATC